MAQVARTRTPEEIGKALNERLADEKKPKRFVKQRDLEDLAERMKQAADLKTELKALAEDIEKRELIIIHAIEHGGTVERGELAPSIETDKGQVRPKWKDEFVKVAGPAAIDRVIAETPAGVDTKHVKLSRKGVAI